MWYLSVFVPASDLGAASALAAAVWPDDPVPSANLSVRLVDGSGAAWRGGNSAMTDAEIAAIQGLATVPGVRWYRYAVVGDHALGASSPEGAEVGASWGWAQSLAAAGLTLGTEA